MKSKEKNLSKTLVEFDFENCIKHGADVAKLAYKVGRKMTLSDQECHDLALAGMLHDIGKLKLYKLINNSLVEPLVIEQLKYVRNHPVLAYEELKNQGYSKYVLDSILYHHENYDGSGYPNNLAGNQIPQGARIIRVCDVYCALKSNRPYRNAFDTDTTLKLMIDEIKNFDMEIFLYLQQVIHEN